MQRRPRSHTPREARRHDDNWREHTSRFDSGRRCEGEAISSNLFSMISTPSDPFSNRKALVSCNDFDLWLAAHLTDVLDKMGLVDDDEEA